MTTLREHILLKYAIVILVVTLVTPSIVKLSHAFANHTHEVCISDTSEHLHEVDLDCEFYKFKKNPESYKNLDYEALKPFVKGQKSITSYYNHVRSHQPLNISLRGPPES